METGPLAAPEDLRDWGEVAVIEAGKEEGAYNKTMMKALPRFAQPPQRVCAHHLSIFFSDLTETLGYVGELFKRIKHLQS